MGGRGAADSGTARTKEPAPYTGTNVDEDAPGGTSPDAGRGSGPRTGTPSAPRDNEEDAARWAAQNQHEKENPAGYQIQSTDSGTTDGGTNSKNAQTNSATNTTSGGKDSQQSAPENPMYWSLQEHTAASEDDCATSATINDKYGCSGTRGSIKTGQTINAVTQAAGSMTTSTLGQVAQMKAMTDQSQTSAYKGAATTMYATGGTQLASGAINTVMGVMHLSQAGKHERNSKEIARGVQGITGDAQGRAVAVAGNDAAMGMVENFGLSNSSAAFAKKKAAIIASQAKGEQRRTKEDATQAGVMALATGVGQLAAGSLSMWAASEMNKAANRLKNPGSPDVPLPLAGNFVGDPAGAPQGMQLVPSGEADTSAALDESADAGAPENGLPGNIDPGKPSGFGGGGPAPGGFKSGGAGGGGGSGGTPSLGGSTSAASGEKDEEGGSKMADAKGSGNYEGGGMMAGGAGGGAADKGPDLSGLLAQFLPKEKEEDPKGGILDFGGKEGGEPAGSLLSKDANLFKRIHETYQEKQQKGNVGGS